MEHDANNTSAELSSAMKNKQMAEFRISILFQYGMYILAKFNTFSRSWKPTSQFNTTWEPCQWL